ncbi:GNAT family N-acetyltransferase [Embleya sp. NPDC055664]|uniref:GNAT family N-acetyltransferase n=1 Tax=Embleya sp. NPDC059237 TaxID=3346784 RepID=UPI0036CFD70E
MTPTPAGARIGGDLYRAEPEPAPDSGALRDRATAAAVRAARAAHVEIRQLHTLDEVSEVCKLLDGIWQVDSANPMMLPELLMVLAHAGGYVAGTYEGDRLTGACVALLATDGLHSHIAGVDVRSRGREVGHALKVHQRAWCLDRGITRISWTFDPLVGRNAFFNLAKLGAVPAEYLVDFYGRLTDAFNAGDHTDRLLVRWDLTAPGVALACEGIPQPVDDAAAPGEEGVAVALDVGADGRPVLGRTDADVVIVRVPRDIDALRRTDTDAVLSWRLAVREVLGGLMGEGRVVRGFGRLGGYVVDRRRDGD